jgi:hypothetical protein
MRGAERRGEERRGGERRGEESKMLVEAQRCAGWRTSVCGKGWKGRGGLQGCGGGMCMIDSCMSSVISDNRTTCQSREALADASTSHWPALVATKEPTRSRESIR